MSNRIILLLLFALSTISIIHAQEFSQRFGQDLESTNLDIDILQATTPDGADTLTNQQIRDIVAATDLVAISLNIINQKVVNSLSRDLTLPQREQVVLSFSETTGRLRSYLSETRNSLLVTKLGGSDQRFVMGILGWERALTAIYNNLQRFSPDLQDLANEERDLRVGIATIRNILTAQAAICQSECGFMQWSGQHLLDRLQGNVLQ